MYKDILRSLDGIAIFPVISIVIFTLFFTLLIIWVIRMDKDKVNRLAAIPLEQGTTTVEEIPTI